LLHIVIVGAGPTGVEVAAEIHDLIEQDFSRNFPEDLQLDVQMTLLEASPTVLSAFDESLQKYTQKFFKRQRIQVRLGAQVKELKDQNTVILGDGSTIKCGMVIWSAGIGPRKLLGLLKDKIPVDPKWKKIPVDDFLRIKGQEDVFAMGDCAVMESKPLAATAQVAQQQGKYLAHLLNTVDKVSEDIGGANNQTLRPFFYRHQGLMAYIGRFHAVTEVCKPNKLANMLDGFSQAWWVH
jgi:NADH dehydrogenase FAD-containing subunit